MFYAHHCSQPFPANLTAVRSSYPLLILCSALRSKLSTPSIAHPSFFVGLLLRGVSLPNPNYGHVVLARPSPILLYPISSQEVGTFELKGTRSGDGVLYASGATTLGGYFPGVDTFLGLQVAAQEIQADLAKRGFGKKIGPLRSTSQWFKWLANTQI